MKTVKDKIKVKPNSVAVASYFDGDAGQLETWFEKATGYEIACYVYEADDFFVDPEVENRKRVSQRTEYPINYTFKQKPFLVSKNWIKELKELGINKVLPIYPFPKIRYKQVKECLEHKMELVSAIHPKAMILEEAIIKPGVYIYPHAIIGYKAEIEPGVIINIGAQIGHHNVLKTCCQVDPGVVMAGYVTLEEKCHVHTGTVVINRITIGEEAIIGAGATVIRNIPRKCTAVGVPAKVIKTLEG